jgi:hypothetical protein
VEHYSDTRKTQVDKTSFIQVNENYGGSPDGLVAPDGAIEVKCPYTSVKHFKHGLIRTDADFKKTAPDYYYQCISHMICANAHWCDFISFDPRVKEEYMMFVYRLHRNEDEVKSMLERVDVAVKHMMEVREKLGSTNNNLITEAI